MKFTKREIIWIKLNKITIIINTHKTSDNRTPTYTSINIVIGTLVISVKLTTRKYLNILITVHSYFSSYKHPSTVRHPTSNYNAYNNILENHSKITKLIVTIFSYLYLEQSPAKHQVSLSALSSVFRFVPRNSWSLIFQEIILKSLKNSSFSLFFVYSLYSSSSRQSWSLSNST